MFPYRRSEEGWVNCTYSNDTTLCFQQHMETYQRGFRQGNMMPWTKQMPQQRGKMAPLGPQSPRFQQLRGSPQQRGGQALWFHKPRRPSEGIFPQKHPGMQSITMEDYDFEKGIEEVSLSKFIVPLTLEQN